MASHNFVYPDYGSSFNAVTGVFTNYSWKNSTFVITRTDTVRRKRPVGQIALFDSGTSVNTQGFNRKDLIYRHYTDKKGSYADRSFVQDHGSLGGSPTFTGTANTTAYNRMLAGARERSVNIGQMAAEYRQTARLFPQLAAAFASKVIEAKRRYRGATGFAKAMNDIQRRRWDHNLADNWLQFQYGVKPLIGDMAESMNRLKNGLKAKPLVTYCKGIGIERYERLLVTGNLQDGTKYTVKEVGETKVTYLGQYTVSLETTNAMAGSIGLTNPIALAWELVPFSFVVDWWLNVGEVLESLDNPLYFNNLKYIRSEKTSYKRIAETAHGSGTYDWFNVSRSAPTSVPLPFAKFKWNLNPSTTHIANGLALLRALTKWK